MIKNLMPGTHVELTGLTKEEHKTQPPSRFTETSLIRALADLGIGRPSTFNSIVSTIQDRGYVMKAGGQLVPTFLGFTVARLLRSKFPTFTDYQYTSQMEENLDLIAEGKETRKRFLKGFWEGKDGFKATMEGLMNSLDFEEIRALTAVDLGNGYEVTYNKFGVFLQEKGAKAPEGQYPPRAKLEESTSIDEVLDPEACRALIERSQKARDTPDRDLGVLPSGQYAGYRVFAREGRFGPFLQAVKEEDEKAEKVNHKLPEGKDLATITLQEVEGLFAEVKLPRNLSSTFFVGRGKKGNYIGHKTSPKARRATFINLPEEYDPRTVTLEEVEAAWRAKKEEAPKEKASSGTPAKGAKKAPAKKKAPARKAPARKAAPKKGEA